MKTCSKCKETKELKLFNKRSCSKDGIDSWCKECSLFVARKAVAKRRKAKDDEISKMQKVQ